MEPVPHPSADGNALPRAEAESWFQNEVQPHETELRHFLRRFAGPDEIDDLVQESFLRLLKARAKAPVFHPRALLLGIGRNAALDLYRRRQTSRKNHIGESDHSEVPDEGPSTPEIVSLRQENTLLEEAIRDLPERCRDVLVLRRLEQLSQKEVAERLSISVKTVEAQLTRALKRCSKYLRKHGDRSPVPGKGGK